MPFSTVKPLLAEAEALLDRSGLRSMDELIDICCAGLGHLSRDHGAYSGVVPFCTAIAPHFENELMGMVRILKNHEDASQDAQSLFGNIQARAFALVEDLALFMREKKLRDGGGPQSAAEERVLSYFESCGNWHADSGEVVTDTYYKLLPIAVLRDIAESRTKKRVHH